MVFAFITFRSMDGVALYNRSYNKWKNNRWKRNLYSGVCSLCCSKNKRHIQSLLIDGRFPQIEEAVLPDNILWENFGVGRCSRWIRMIIAVIIGIVILFCSIGAIIGINAGDKELKN